MTMTRVGALWWRGERSDGVYGQATASGLNLNVVPGIIPEPSTYALQLLAGGGALWWTRRCR